MVCVTVSESPNIPRDREGPPDAENSEKENSNPDEDEIPLRDHIENNKERRDEAAKRIYNFNGPTFILENIEDSDVEVGEGEFNMTDVDVGEGESNIEGGSPDGGHGFVGLLKYIYENHYPWGLLLLITILTLGILALGAWNLDSILGFL